ncbi:hypothetical protein EIN_306410 [Entamoeba invadens IP1]|uniref:Uncharacterized protein n=1 Tax=Entamoeba invadens IP1 TaxID=370355 RepID=A0A0A1TYW2_ENTIV|nr:hypothetical protein EIN_306410 [Entamoeba invadens IP1]ELP86715.1 hypothetical protein EIN_306410 [Entamoeba invadens IP1]|eukprot:XP_004186061.1 hypothetical protein EIN_306410 [Entamoeba invadens IP1]
MSDDQALKHIMDRDEKYVREHMRGYLKEKNPDRLALIQLCAATQGCVPLVHPFLKTNSPKLNSELLAVAIYNQHIPLVDLILSLYQKTNQLPLALQFTQLFGPEHYPFSLFIEKVEPEKVEKVELSDHQLHVDEFVEPLNDVADNVNINESAILQPPAKNASSNSLNPILDGNSERSNTSENSKTSKKSIFDIFKSLKLSTPIRNEINNVNSIFEPLNQNSVLFLGDTIVNTSDSKIKFFFYKALPTRRKVVEVRAMSARVALEIGIGSLHITVVNKTIYTLTSTYPIPSEDICLFFSSEFFEIGSVKIPNPPDAESALIWFEMSPFSALSVSNVTSVPTHDTYENFVDFNYPKVLERHLPPPLMSHISVLLLSLSKVPNDELFDTVISKLSADCVEQQIKMTNQFCLRQCAFQHLPREFERLKSCCNEIDESVFRALVSSPFTRSHRKILQMLPIKEFSRTPIGAIDDIAGINAALKMAPAPCHIINDISLIETALKKKSIAALEVLCRRKPVGVDITDTVFDHRVEHNESDSNANKYSTKILEAFLESTLQASQIISKVVKYPFDYFTVNLTATTNPEAVAYMLENGAKCGRLNSFNESCNEIIYKHHPTCVDQMEDGGRPLHKAVQEGNWRFVEWLLEHGADATKRDLTNKKAIEYIEQTEDNKSCFLLLEEKSHEMSIGEKTEVYVEGVDILVVPNSHCVVVSKVNSKMHVSVTGKDLFELKSDYESVLGSGDTLLIVRKDSMKVVDVVSKSEKDLPKNYFINQQNSVICGNTCYCALPGLDHKETYELWKSELSTSFMMKRVVYDFGRIDYITSDDDIVVVVCNIFRYDNNGRKYVSFSPHDSNDINTIHVEIVREDSVIPIPIEVSPSALEWESSEIESVCLSDNLLFFFVKDAKSSKPHFVIDFVTKQLVGLPQQFEVVHNGACIFNKSGVYCENNFINVFDLTQVLFSTMQRLLGKFMRSDVHDYVMNNGIDFFKFSGDVLRCRIPQIFEKVNTQSKSLYVSLTKDEMEAFLLYIYTGNPSFPVRDFVVVDRRQLLYRAKVKLESQFRVKIEIFETFERVVEDFENMKDSKVMCEVSTRNGTINVQKEWFNFLFKTIDKKCMEKNSSLEEVAEQWNHLNSKVWFKYICLF